MSKIPTTNYYHFLFPNKHYFALVSKQNTTKFNSNPQWDYYIQHGETTPKPTKI